MKWAKVAKKSSTYNVTHKKSKTPNQKKFFLLQIRRAFEHLAFEHLDSSLAFSASELCPCNDTCKQSIFTRTAWINLGGGGVEHRWI